MYKKADGLLLDCLKELWVRHFDVPGKVPRKMNKRDNGFKALQLVPFIAFQAQSVLSGCKWTYIPGNIIAPTNCLNPMNTSC